jgi:ribosomal protein L12E/L44/L45/RPP1/RPP2
MPLVWNWLYPSLWPTSLFCRWERTTSYLFLVAAADITNFLKECGVKGSKDNITSMMKAIDKRPIHELCKEGSKHLASVPTGGSAVASGAVANTPEVQKAPA